MYRKYYYHAMKALVFSIWLKYYYWVYYWLFGLCVNIFLKLQMLYSYRFYFNHFAVNFICYLMNLSKAPLSSLCSLLSLFCLIAFPLAFPHCFHVWCSWQQWFLLQGACPLQVFLYTHLGFILLLRPCTFVLFAFELPQEPVLCRWLSPWRGKGPFTGRHFAS